MIRITTRRCGVAFAAALIAGCGAPAPILAPDPAPAANALLERGYRPARRFKVEERTDRLTDADGPIDVTLAIPVMPAGERAPLVVYLPGLGETASAGRLWRTTWSEAGYAVVTLQPDALGSGIGRSPRARAGAFRGLAMEATATDALARRVAQITRAIDTVRRGAEAGLPGYLAIDASRVAAVGFHIGARVAVGLSADARVGASIAVGWAGGAPTAGLASAKDRLVIAATGDVDPFGFTPRDAGRSLGGRHVLLLSGGSHALLAGGGYYGPRQAEDAFAPATVDPRNRPIEERRGQPPDLRQSDRRRLPQREAFDPAHIAAVQAVTTAFLDATMRGDVRAVQWLARDAQGWLGSAASLR